MQIKYFFLGVISTLIIMFIAIIFFILGKNKDNKLIENSYENNELITETQIITPTPKLINYDEVKQTIEYALINNEYNVLEEFLDEYVAFKIENSILLEKQLRKEAIERLEFLESSENDWNFEQENPDIKSLVASFPENYSQSVIGITSDFYSASFQLDNTNKIVKISLSSSYKKLLNEGSGVVQ